MRYYFVITYLPEERDNNFLASRCINILHKFNGRYQLHCIGISFPRWSDYSVGEQVAFVCEDEMVLKRLIKSKDITLMKEHGVIELTDVCLVNEYLHEEVKFIHNKSIDKFTGKGKKRIFERLKKRALSRGESEYKPKNEINRILNVRPYQNIPMKSSSTKQEQFNLHVQVTGAEKVSFGNFDIYGLATTSKWLGSVPLRF